MWWASRYLAILCTVVLSGVAGCARDTARDVQAAASWTASAEMVGAQWLQEHVPTRYAVRALGRAAEEIAREGDDGRATAAAIRALRDAIAAHDGAAARRALADVAARRAVLARRALEARS
jgi:hypothetical protein